jgi:dTDP-4-amino-4,6-dideoxygalactose transaminase
VSTANAFALRGARLVFGDVRPDTLNLDEKGLERLITGRTKAIAVVHYAGVACEMDSILELAGARGVPVVEDNAHGLFARYKGKNLGSMGCLAAQSFHETKNFTCGEGGALIVNDPSLEERAEIIREKGTDRSRFFRGQVDKYTWVSLGSSYVPSDILAAFLFSQLESRSEIQAKRRGIWERYHAGLREWAQRREIGLPYVPRHCEQSYHMFYLILPSLEKRQALIRRLKSRGIQSVFHYSPLHLSGMGRFFGARAGDCPVAESMGDRLLRLPFFNTMTEEEQAYIVETIQDEGV